MRIRLFMFGSALMLAGACAEAADRVLTVTCAEAGAFELGVPGDWVVTAVWKAADRKPPSTLDEIRTRIARTAQAAGAAGAPLRPVPADAVTGYFFDAGGDITPEPYSMLRQGMLKVGDLTVSFTAMGAPGHEADQDALIERLARAMHRR